MTWARRDLRSWERNSVPKRREAEKSGEESILQTECRFQEERSSVERAEERAKEGAQERADDSILETKFLFKRREAVVRADAKDSSL